jgi:hypothetical protein
MFRKARAQGAVTGYVHPWPNDTDPLDSDLGVGKGFPVDLALGVVDAYEWSNSSRGQLKVWHHTLNNDLRVTPTGGEDSISNMHVSKPVGSLRTYAHFGGGPFTVATWLKTLRQGTTYFTGGPLLEFTVADKMPGDVVRLPAGGGRVRITARAWSITPLSQVVIYRNGSIFKELPIDAKHWSGRTNKPCAELDVTVEAERSGWYSLYAEGPASDVLDVRFPQAATNAIRVYVGDEKIRNRASGDYFIRWIDKLAAMAEKWPWWRSQKERDHVFAQFEEARRVYERVAAEAN